RWQCVRALYRCLLIAMVAGRVVWGLVQAVLLGLTGSAMTLQIFLAGALLNAIPGIIVQLILIPVVMLALNRTGLVPLKQTNPKTKNAGAPALKSPCPSQRRAGVSACRKSATLQGEPISACCAGQKFL